MNDTLFLGELKRKRNDHLAEIRRLQGLVDSLTKLISEYSPDKGSHNGELEFTPSPEVINMNLTDAIYEVMQTSPGKAWRGSEIHRFLKSKGYHLNNLSQKISSRLIERSKADTGKWYRIEGDDGYPRYRTKEAEETENSIPVVR